MCYLEIALAYLAASLRRLKSFELDLSLRGLKLILHKTDANSKYVSSRKRLLSRTATISFNLFKSD